MWDPGVIDDEQGLESMYATFGRAANGIIWTAYPNGDPVSPGTKTQVYVHKRNHARILDTYNLEGEFLRNRSERPGPKELLLSTTGAISDTHGKLLGDLTTLVYDTALEAAHSNLHGIR